MNSLKIFLLLVALPILSFGQTQEEVTVSDSTRTNLSSLTDLTRTFIGQLKREEFDAAKEYLAPTLAAQLEDAQLIQLSSIIHDVEVDMIYHGIEKGMKDAVFQMLHFKYSADNSDSPKEIIKVLFDKNDKIAGFQPLKMK